MLSEGEPRLYAEDQLDLQLLPAPLGGSDPPTSYSQIPHLVQILRAEEQRLR